MLESTRLSSSSVWFQEWHSVVVVVVCVFVVDTHGKLLANRTCTDTHTHTNTDSQWHHAYVTACRFSVKYSLLFSHCIGRAGVQCRSGCREDTEGHANVIRFDDTHIQHGVGVRRKFGE